MTYKELIYKLAEQKANIVITDAAHKMTGKSIDCSGMRRMTDARDAVFFALGYKDVNDKLSCCVISHEEFGSSYTGLVEAAMRGQAIALIVLNGMDEDIDASFLRNYSVAIKNSGKMQNVDEIVSSTHPIVIECKIDTENDCNKFDSEKLKAIAKALPDGYTLAGNRLAEILPGCKVVDFGRDPYGVVSRYLGMIQAKDNLVLAVDELNMKLDLNLLNSRYANNKIKIIVMGDLGVNLNKWCEANKFLFKTYDGSELLHAVDYVCGANQPCIVHIA